MEDTQVEQDTKLVQSKYKFDELKFLSASILNTLGRHLTSCSAQDVPVPEGVVNIFIQGFDQLVLDAVVEKREWQTDCYLDLKPSKKPFIVRETVDLDRIDTKKSKMDAKHERPTTAKSTVSALSIKSDVSNASSHNGREYDKLPPELRAQGPMILRYRRETQAPQPSVKMPKTRIEKYNAMKGEARAERRKGTFIVT